MASLKSGMQKTELKKSSFFNEISLEYKAIKLPQNYMEREESQISLTGSLKWNVEKINLIRFIFVCSQNFL